MFFTRRVIRQYWPCAFSLTRPEPTLVAPHLTRVAVNSNFPSRTGSFRPGFLSCLAFVFGFVSFPTACSDGASSAPAVASLPPALQPSITITATPPTIHGHLRRLAALVEGFCSDEVMSTPGRR